MTTEQGNKLIAEFMGAKFHDEDAYGNGHIRYFAVFEVGNHPSYLIKSAGRKFEVSDLIYHSSWDWLMPVVEKIEAMREGTTAPYDVDIENSECHITYKNGSETISWVCDHRRSKIEVTWQAVVEFVRWQSEFGGDLKD